MPQASDRGHAPRSTGETKREPETARKQSFAAFEPGAGTLARGLLFHRTMLRTHSGKDTTLTAWLSAVNAHLDLRRSEGQLLQKPKRNRERERARREARQLFAEFYAEQIERLAS